MSLVEKDITSKNVELARYNPEFEKRQETEHKLVPQHPELLAWLFADKSQPVEQIYLSNPDDEWSLRVRHVGDGETDTYSATLKSRGELVTGALQRLEIETPISREAFEQYKAMDRFPTLTKSRAHIMEGVTVDFYTPDEQTPPAIVEVEHQDAFRRRELIQSIQEITGPLIDDSQNTDLTNEAIAHRQAAARQPEKMHVSPESLDVFTHRIVKEMLTHYATGKNQVVVGLTGMSGSGKTTVTSAIQEQITELFGETYRPIIISTDDYHFGKATLEATHGAPYTDWDSPKTYNTRQLATELAMLKEGHPLTRRHFSFDTEEPVFDDEVAPSPFVIVEGLYAGSDDLNDVRDLHFELPTSIATSIGRDVRRLVIEQRANRVFPTPESRLKYQIETALPLYLSQERPKRKAFSASTRLMGERASMLMELSE